MDYCFSLKTKQNNFNHIGPDWSINGSQATGVPYPANGRPYTSGMRTSSQSVIKRQKVSQGEAPNPVVFVATKDTRYILLS